MRTFDTPEPIVAVFDIGAGHLEIRASDRSDTVVDVRPANASDDGDVQAAGEVRVDFADGQLSVRAPKRKLRSLFGRPPQVDVFVDLPTDSRVEVSSWADVRTEGRLGDATFKSAAGPIRLAETGRLKVRTGAGDVSVTRSVGHTDVETSSGKIRLGGIDGSAVVKTSNGDITVGEVTGDVRLTTANGDIAVERALDEVEAKTAFGSVRIGEVVRGTVSISTSFGELEVGIREGTAAWLDVSSGYGHVRTELDEAERPEPADETVRLRARTSFGDVVVRRAAPAVPS